MEAHFTLRKQSNPIPIRRPGDVEACPEGSGVLKWQWKRKCYLSHTGHTPNHCRYYLSHTGREAHSMVLKRIERINWNCLIKKSNTEILDMSSTHTYRGTSIAYFWICYTWNRKFTLALIFGLRDLWTAAHRIHLQLQKIWILTVITFSYLISESKLEVIQHLTLANWALWLFVEAPFDA